MRHRDLFGVAIVISIGLVYCSKYVLPLLGVKIGFIAELTSPLVASFVIAPLLLLILAPLNNRFREWRKAHGRDIAEEERYETDHGMIKLTPNEDSNSQDECSGETKMYS